MRALYTYPPNFAAIHKAFNTRGKPVIYAYGGVIHNPHRIKIPPQLLVHEQVHVNRQGADPAGWWQRYIAEPTFRLAEEIPAHIAEYRMMKNYEGPECRWLGVIADRLASPLYGSLVSHAEAKRILIDGV